MAWIQPLLVALVLLCGVGAFGYVLWTRRLGHVWPKRGQLRITNPSGFFPGAWEVLSQSVVLRNRPWVGLFHLPLFFGLLFIITEHDSCTLFNETLGCFNPKDLLQLPLLNRKPELKGLFNLIVRRKFITSLGQTINS